MKINFTKQQYKHLVELLYLGEWTANSSKVQGERNNDYDALYQYVCSFAKQFGLDDDITYDKSLDGYYPTLQFEENLQPIINHNDNEVFWNELSIRLAKRDLAKLNEDLPTSDAYVERLFQIEEKYEDEFAKHGIENLVIKEKK